MLDKKEVKVRVAYLPRDNRLLDIRPRGLLSRITTIERLGQAFDWLVRELTKIAIVVAL